DLDAENHAQFCTHAICGLVIEDWKVKQKKKGPKLYLKKSTRPYNKVWSKERKPFKKEHGKKYKKSKERSGKSF
ncbi:hypothetical protein UZ36_07330, partial [Candidatus Nitromaritima sp. SCGC AAA799-C22]